MLIPSSSSPLEESILKSHASACEAVIDVHLKVPLMSNARGFFVFTNKDFPLEELLPKSRLEVLKTLEAKYSEADWNVYLEEFNGKFSLRLSDPKVPARSNLFGFEETEFIGSW